MRDRIDPADARVREISALADRVFRAETVFREHPTDETAKLDLEMVRLEQRLFEAEHDNTGAFKFNRLGRHIQQLFETGPDGRAAVETDAGGRFVLPESQSRRRFLLVNMGELDRFNKEGGGHAAGDAALSATEEQIEQTLGTALKGATGSGAEHAVYRYDGNTFLIDLADISEEQAYALEVRLCESQPSVQGVREPAPLTVGRVDMADALALLNHLQAELPDGAKLDSGEEAARELVEVLRRAADWQMEAAKLGQRADRMREKIASQDPEAREFFDNYLKKAFQGTALATFDDFEKAVTGEAADDFPETVQQMALAAAEKRFAGSRRVEDQFQEIVEARVKARGIPPLLPEAGEFVLPGKLQTGGDRVLDAKRVRMETFAKDAKANPQDGLAARRAQNARLEYQLETARRDRGTGLLARGAHYEDLERAIEGNRDVAVVFVDMGFLKYFDQMGGTDVGDRALKTAALLMEQALGNAGLEGEVYRYGGDEFTIQVEGGADAADRFIAALKALEVAADPIPKGPKSLAEYAPTKLSFNCGLADRAMLEAVYAAAVAGGEITDEDRADPGRLRNLQAELMTRAADTGIEYEKAYSRFLLLIEALRGVKEASDPGLRARQVEALINFSNKAIFAELGGRDHLLDLAADLSLQNEVLEEAVLDYVLRTVGEVRAREKNRKEFLDVLLAAETRVSFLKAHVARLQRRIDTLEQANAVQRAQLEQAIRHHAQAEADRQEIIAARGTLDKVA